MNTLENQNAIFPKGEKTSPGYFTGIAWLNMLVPQDETGSYAIGNVVFEPVGTARAAVRLCGGPEFPPEPLQQASAGDRAAALEKSMGDMQKSFDTQIASLQELMKTLQEQVSSTGAARDEAVAVDHHGPRRHDDDEGDEHQPDVRADQREVHAEADEQEDERVGDEGGELGVLVNRGFEVRGARRTGRHRLAGTARPTRGGLRVEG